MKTRIITLGLSTSRTWKPFSAMIRWWFGTPYSHVYLKWDTPWGFSEVLEASGMAVRMREAKTWEKDQKVIQEYHFEVSKAEFDRVMSELRPLTGHPYGWGQCVGIALAELLGLDRNPFADDSRSLICSELGFKFLEILGIAPTVKDTDLISPKDIKDILDGVF